MNILDPAKHKKSVSEQNYAVTDGKALLPLEALKDTVKVTDYTAGEDFDLFYEGENLILEVIEGGSIPERTGELTIAFDAVDPSKIAEKDIIGGFEVSTKKYSGLELIDKVFPKYGIVCDMIPWRRDGPISQLSRRQCGQRRKPSTAFSTAQRP